MDVGAVRNQFVNDTDQCFKLFLKGLEVLRNIFMKNDFLSYL